MAFGWTFSGLAARIWPASPGENRALVWVAWRGKGPWSLLDPSWLSRTRMSDVASHRSQWFDSKWFTFEDLSKFHGTALKLFGEKMFGVSLTSRLQRGFSLPFVLMVLWRKRSPALHRTLRRMNSWGGHIAHRCTSLHIVLSLTSASAEPLSWSSWSRWCPEGKSQLWQSLLRISQVCKHTVCTLYYALCAMKIHLHCIVCTVLGPRAVQSITKRAER